MALHLCRPSLLDSQTMNELEKTFRSSQSRKPNITKLLICSLNQHITDIRLLGYLITAIVVMDMFVSKPKKELQMTYKFNNKNLT
jgi:hypothetical protein